MDINDIGNEEGLEESPGSENDVAIPVEVWVGQDLQHKRAKAHYGSIDRTYVPSCSKSSTNSEFEHSHEDGGVGEVGDKAEDLEVRMDLSDDLLHTVFSFLGQIDLCRVAMVCKQWQAVSGHEDFWSCLNFEYKDISIEQFKDMCRRYPDATSLNLTGAPLMHLLAMNAVSSLRNLETLILGRGNLGGTFFQALPDFKMLRTLNVTAATLGNGIQEIPINHDGLRHLQLILCGVTRISVGCPNLERLSLKRSHMAEAQLNCPLLHDLDIGYCHKLSDAAIRSAVISCPLLESLDMSDCPSLSDETLRDLAFACANLRILNASNCSSISLESVRLITLTTLKLGNCESITSASMAAISRSYMLEVLELDNCSLTSVSLDLPRLQDIRLVHCRKFVVLNLLTPMLSSIMISKCPALRSINLTSNSLKKLALQKQERLITVTLKCQSLEEVDLTDCRSLRDLSCELSSKGAGYPMLKSIVLDNCESLMTARFCSSSLVSLSIAGCWKLTTLGLTCPNRQQLNLDDHLERPSFRPVGLRSLNLGICPKLSKLVIEAPEMNLLDLKGCGVLTEASINCPLLTSLDASFCSLLKDECLSAIAASCPLIETLILMSCSLISDNGLRSLCQLPRLTTLDLSYTFLTDLLPVFESCLQLKVLRLQACKYLSDSSLEPLYKQGALSSLQDLDLSYVTICQTAIEELLACCTHLTHVNLNGCSNLHDLDWSGPNYTGTPDPVQYKSSHEPVDKQPERLLEVLSCVGCRNMRKVLIPPYARCFYLSSLNLSVSANLKEVDISCLSLCILNLSNCCSLEKLKLDCPNLTSLFLQSCNIDKTTLESAILHCPMLETLDIRFCPKILPVCVVRLRTMCHGLKRIFGGI